MGVYIKGMTLDEAKWLLGPTRDNEIVEIKTPHGRLIDAEMLTEYALNQTDKSVTPNTIMRFPCVIEAEVEQ